MAGTEKADATRGARRSGGTTGKPPSPRMALAIGLALGSVLTALVQQATSTQPALDQGGLKDEARLAAGYSAPPQLAGCTALAQDRFTGATIAVDCGEALPLRRPARRAAAIES